MSKHTFMEYRPTYYGASLKQCEKLLAHFGYAHEYHEATDEYCHIVRFRHDEDEDEPRSEWIGGRGYTKLEAYQDAIEFGETWYVDDWLSDTGGENYDFDVVRWGNSLRILKNKPCLIRGRS